MPEEISRRKSPQGADTPPPVPPSPLQEAPSAEKKPIKYAFEKEKPPALTTREEEIVGYVADAQKNGEIAIRIGVQNETVEKHINNILRKLGTTERTGISKHFYEQVIAKLKQENNQPG